MKGTGQLEWNDYWNAWRLENRQWAPARILLWVFLCGILGLGVFGAFMMSTSKGNLLEYVLWFIPGLVVAALLLLLPQWNQRQQLKMAFEQDKRMSTQFDVELTDAELNMTSPVGNSKYPWDYIRKWNADENVVLLYVSDSARIILPLRTLGGPDAVQFIKDKLAQNRIPHADKLKNRRSQVIVALLLVLIAIIAVVTLVMPELTKVGK